MPGEGRTAGLPRGALVYLVLLTLAAGALLWWLLRDRGQPPAVDWQLAGLLFMLALTAQHFPLPLAPRYHVDVTSAIYFAALLLFGPAGGAVFAAAGQLGGGLTLWLRRNPATGRRRRGAPGVIFNAAQFTLATGVAGLVYTALAPRASTPLDTLAALWAIPAAGATLHVLNSGAVALMVGLQRGRPPLRDWLATQREELPEAAGLLILGVATALLAASHPAGPLLLALPAALLQVMLTRAAVAGAAREVAEARLAHQATHDPLTGLANRALFLDRVEHALARADGRPGTLAVLFVDVDRFKIVNDSLGHPAGDRLLVAIAARLRDALGPADTAARLGGDEFALLLEDLSAPVEAVRRAEHLAVALATPIPLGGHALRVTTSIGVVVRASQHRGAADLLRDADAAMYRAKSAGGARHAEFDEAMGASARERLALEAGLWRGLERGELRLHYQPQADLVTGLVAGVEALVRWEPPGLRLIPPATFIPIAEETGQIVPLGRWVLREACRQAGGWAERYPDRAVLVAVNVSARQLQHPDLADDVARALAEGRLPPDRLVLELTETALMADLSAGGGALATLRALGVRLALDDFGTGYSSLAYLRRLPVDVLKIDKSFVGGVARDRTDVAIAGAVVTLARTLGLRTVAEGVETAEQLATLRALGCDLGQGWHFARALPPEEIDTLLAVEAAAGTGLPA